MSSLVFAARGQRMVGSATDTLRWVTVSALAGLGLLAFGEVEIIWATYSSLTRMGDPWTVQDDTALGEYIRLGCDRARIEAWSLRLACVPLAVAASLLGVFGSRLLPGDESAEAEAASESPTS
jgi:hypothetical protein